MAGNREELLQRNPVASRRQVPAAGNSAAGRRLAPGGSGVKNSHPCGGLNRGQVFPAQNAAGCWAGWWLRCGRVGGCIVLGRSMVWTMPWCHNSLRVLGDTLTCFERGSTMRPVWQSHEVGLWNEFFDAFAALLLFLPDAGSMKPRGF